jgi:hypothetical protein
MTRQHQIDRNDRPPSPRDTGLRRMLTWTFIALVFSILMAMVGVNLVIHFFDRAS